LAKAIRFSRRSHPRSPAWAYRQTRISSAPPAIEAARRVPVKHLKIDPLPAALDSDGSKPDHQPPSDPLSARRLGDKKIFKIHPGSAEPSREPGVEQGKTGGLAVEKGEQRLESLPDGVYYQARQHFSETELVNLTLCVAAINAWNRIAIGFRAVHPTHWKGAA
jgi:hypothetical protein